MQTTIETPDISGVVSRIRAAASPETLRGAYKAAADGVADLVVKHFRMRGAKPSSNPGWPKSNFWGDASETENYAVRDDDEGGSVTFSKEGVALRLHGGTVRPTGGKKFLAIPVNRLVATMWPSEYTGEGNKIFQWRSKTGNRFLAESDGKNLRLLWLLKEQTVHQPDPTVLPRNDELQTAATEAAEIALRRHL